MGYLAILLWALSISASSKMNRQLKFVRFKDLADRGYKLSITKMKDINEIYEEEIPGILNYDLAYVVMPIYNLIFPMRKKHKYDRKIDKIITRLKDEKLINEMNGYDKNLYGMVPSFLTFMALSASEEEENADKSLLMKIQSDDNTTGVVNFVIDETLSDVKVLNMSRSLYMLGEDEVKNKILSLSKKYKNLEMFISGLNDYNNNNIQKSIINDNKEQNKKPVSEKMPIKQERTLTTTEKKKRLLKLKKEIILHTYAAKSENNTISKIYTNKKRS